ncbi:helix-turn-helix domain-containing protein [Pseudomonas tolaasii]|nr:helix-turn-helix domain-containing protein [Pseudomonas tolaasii]
MMQMAQFRLLSVRQAAKYLDVTEEVAYDLVRHDLLKSTIETKSGATYRRVTLSSIEDFKRSYITGTELAYALAIPSNQVLARMLNLKISPIAGPSPGLLRCRRYFWSRLSCLYAVRPGS